MGRFLLCIAYLAGTGVWLLYSLLLDALRCDDSCGTLQNGDGWGDLAGSWQWQGIAVCGVVGAVAAIAVVILTLRRPAAAAVAAAAIHGAAMAYAVTLIQSAGRLGDTGPPVLGAVLLAGAGVWLALLSRRRATTIEA